jgi:hypothetical protein
MISVCMVENLKTEEKRRKKKEENRPQQDSNPLPPLPGFPQKSSQMSRLSPTYTFGALSSQGV